MAKGVQVKILVSMGARSARPVAKGAEEINPHSGERPAAFPKRYPIAILLVILLVGGCGGSKQPPMSSGPLLALHGNEPAPAARRIEGKAVLDDRGCLRLMSEPSLDGDQRHGGPTMLVPAGYTFDLGPEQKSVSVLNGQRELAFRVGDVIVAKGGYVDAPLDAVAGISGQTADRLEGQCPGSYLYVDSVLERSG